MDDPLGHDPLSLGETVEHAGWDQPLCVGPAMSIRDVLSLLKEKRLGSVLICRGERLAGIFTERDALSLMASDSSRPKVDLGSRIETVMTANPATVKPQDTVGTAIEKMSHGGYRRLPVVDGEGRPVGELNVASIVHFLVQQFPQAVYNLPPAPDNVMQEREGA